MQLSARGQRAEHDERRRGLDEQQAACRGDVRRRGLLATPEREGLAGDVFNTAETSWDCPCHGSRFSVDGTVLNGPASRPLSALDPENAAHA